jgi:hypothetical protein
MAAAIRAAGKSFNIVIDFSIEYEANRILAPQREMEKRSIYQRIISSRSFTSPREVDDLAPTLSSWP